MNNEVIRRYVSFRIALLIWLGTFNLIALSTCYNAWTHADATTGAAQLEQTAKVLMFIALPFVLLAIGTGTLRACSAAFVMTIFVALAELGVLVAVACTTATSFTDSFSGALGASMALVLSCGLAAAKAPPTGEITLPELRLVTWSGAVSSRLAQARRARREIPEEWLDGAFGQWPKHNKDT